MIPVSSRVGPVILAHRGGIDEAPENSFAAFEHTRSLGVRHIETDAHLTADGRVVVCHDPLVDRCYDGSGEISRMSWADLSQLRNEANEPMPLLSEVLERFPDMYFNIDAKAPGIEDALLDVVEAHDALGRVVLASFSEPRLVKIRERTQMRASTSIGVSAVARLVGAAKTATSPQLWRVPGPRQGVVAVQVPVRQGPLTVVDRRFVAAAHRCGLAVHVWTIDEPDDVMALIEVGVDGFVTNRPRALRDLLVERGLWEELPAPGESARAQRPRD